MYKLTIFTPSFNRCHTLQRLYRSITEQTCIEKVEWLIIDDCSTDGTEQVVKDWLYNSQVSINYVRLSQNGGKPRAINLACEMARSPYLFIVDSDDYLERGIVEFILQHLDEIAIEPKINGLGVMRRMEDGSIFAKPTFQKYVDATNLERRLYGLHYDCNEVYKIEVLKKYPFKVWPGEIFTPESVVLNAMAADGYKIRWYNTAGVISEYHEDGMTRGSWNLQRNNPMGYAMLFNSDIQYNKDVKTQIRLAVQFVAQCLLGKNSGYIIECNAKFFLPLAIPLGILLYFRRRHQYKTRV